MMDFMFFVKTLALTVAVVLVMQIEIGHRSIETHAMSWVQSSAIVAPLNTVAAGGAKLVRDTTKLITAKLSRTQPKTAKKAE
ncbi:MAG TPA: hypothetical protein PKC28_08455 [Bdellovibrionales bacterium]|nr:hypothetical protein [Bdellovibrionales bacterium]